MNIELTAPERGQRPKGFSQILLGLGLSTGMAILFGIVGLVIVYNSMRLDVPTGKQAVLIRKTGTDLQPNQELAPPPEQGRYYKGVQSGGLNNGVLTEGRYFFNPLEWGWEVKEQMIIPEGQLGVRINLVGKEMGSDQVLAETGQKGISREVLRPGSGHKPGWQAGGESEQDSGRARRAWGAERYPSARNLLSKPL